jgi:hypothetical protein
VNFGCLGIAGALNGDPPERGDLIRLAAAADILLSIAERVDGEIVDEAFLADLYELRDRAYMALERL